jgi:hypothetical protein
MTKIETTLIALAVCVAGCLPADTRPPPGRLTVELLVPDSSSEFETGDGWRVSYDEFLLGIGEVELGGDDCNPYTESDYLRLLDLRRSGAQRLNIAYALGGCELSFKVQSPSREAVLGEGVEASAMPAMSEPGSDAFVEDAGTVLYVAGRARRADRELSFAWSFRRELEYPECTAVTLTGEEELRVELEARPKVLFSDRLDQDSGQLLFEPFAAADVDGDDVVTLDELARVPLEPSPGEPFTTLAERLYLGLVPAVVGGPRGEWCSSHVPEDDF